MLKFSQNIILSLRTFTVGVAAGTGVGGVVRKLKLKNGCRRVRLLRIRLDHYTKDAKTKDLNNILANSYSLAGHILT